MAYDKTRKSITVIFLTLLIYLWDIIILEHYNNVKISCKDTLFTYTILYVIFVFQTRQISFLILDIKHKLIFFKIFKIWKLFRVFYLLKSNISRLYCTVLLLSKLPTIFKGKKKTKNKKQTTNDRCVQWLSS